MNPLVSCSKLTKIYSADSQLVYALRDISLEIFEGEFSCLSGPSGSGKTTLLNLIGGLDRASEGAVYLEGMLLNDLSRNAVADIRLRKVGFVFQSFNLIPVLSAQENVEFPLQLQGVPWKDRRDRSRRILAEVGLSGYEARRPGSLSGGQQQRVAVARALAHGAKLILADEPTANLDSVTAGNLLNLMRDLNRHHGVTFLFSTHDPHVMDHATRIIRLHDGSVVEDEKRGSS